MKVEDTDIRLAVKKALDSAVWKKAGKKDKVRKFNEAIELVVNIRDLDLKDPNNRFAIEYALPHSINDPVKACIIADGDMLMKAKELGYDTIDKDWLQNARTMEKRVIKKVCKKYRFFIARADLMRLVAPSLGRYLAPINKMPIPQPNGYSVITPTSNLKDAVDKFKNVTRIIIKKSPLVQLKIGSKKMKEEEIIENALALMHFLLQKMPRGQDNIRSVYVKTTMGHPISLAKAQEA
jgi:large subunit ribosomal protein L1